MIDVATILLALGVLVGYFGLAWIASALFSGRLAVDVGIVGNTKEPCGAVVKSYGLAVRARGRAFSVMWTRRDRCCTEQDAPRPEVA